MFYLNQIQSLNGLAPRFHCQNLVEIVRTGQGATRQEIARHLKISPALVNIYASRLLKKGWITVAGRSKGRVGRRTDYFSVPAGKARVLCIDVAPGALYARLFNFRAQEILAREVPVKAGGGQAGFLLSIRDGINGILSDSRVSAAGLKTVVCVEGSVIQEHGIVFEMEHADAWTPLSLSNYLEPVCGAAPQIISRTTAIVHYFAMREKLENFIYLKIHGHLAYGQVEKGAIQKGHIGTAGPLSHLGLVKAGPLCACGQAGCLEAVETAAQRWEAIREYLLARLSGRERKHPVLVNTGGLSGLDMQAGALNIRTVSPSVNAVLEGAFHAGARACIKERV